MVNTLLVAALLASPGPVGSASGGATGCYGSTVTMKYAYATVGDCVGHPKVSSVGQFVVLLSAAPVSDEDLEAVPAKWHWIFVRGGQISFCFQDGEYGWAEVHTGNGTERLDLDQKAKKPVIKDGRVSGAVRTAGHDDCRVDVSFDAPLRAPTATAK
jgi:hypothetical protein